MPVFITIEELQAVVSVSKTIEDNSYVQPGTYWKCGAHSILEAEVLVLLEAIKVACTMNLEHITFESDSQLVVEATHDANYSGVSGFSILISNIRNLLNLIPTLR
jgi:ribonuclease HI